MSMLECFYYPLSFSMLFTSALKSLVLLFSVCCFFFLAVYVAYAQNPNAAGIGLSPAIIEGGAIPGEVQEHPVTITNLSGARQIYYLFMRDIVGVEGAGAPIFATENQERTGFELSEWVTLDRTEIALNPGEETTVRISIAVPENATPGSHFGGMFVSMDPPRLRSTGAAVGYEVANIISIRVAGDAIESAQIRSFSTDNFIYSRPTIDFTARIENKGTVLVRPVGPVEVHNMFGKRVALLTMNESRGGVFPLSERTFSIKWEDEGPGFGRYEAILSMVYGDQGRQATISSTASFWILPMNIILPAAGVLALLLLIVFVVVRLYINSAIAGYAGSRRIVRRRRGRSGMSALLLVLIVMLGVTALFLVVLLALFA